MEENMCSDSESSFVGLVFQQRNTALAASFLSCPPNCENYCGNKATSEDDITWYFGRAIQIPFLRVKRTNLKACKIVNFKPRLLKLWKRVFLKANFKTKEKQISVHKHFKQSHT